MPDSPCTVCDHRHYDERCTFTVSRDAGVSGPCGCLWVPAPSPSTVDEARAALWCEEVAYARAAIGEGSTLASTEAVDAAIRALVAAVRRAEQQVASEESAGLRAAVQAAVDGKLTYGQDRWEAAERAVDISTEAVRIAVARAEQAEAHAVEQEQLVEGWTSRALTMQTRAHEAEARVQGLTRLTSDLIGWLTTAPTQEEPARRYSPCGETSDSNGCPTEAVPTARAESASIPSQQSQ